MGWTRSVKVHLHWAKANAKVKFVLWSLSLLNVNIKLDSLRTHVEAMSLSLKYKRTPMPRLYGNLRQNLWTLTLTQWKDSMSILCVTLPHWCRCLQKHRHRCFVWSTYKSQITTKFNISHLLTLLNGMYNCHENKYLVSDWSTTCKRQWKRLMLIENLFSDQSTVHLSMECNQCVCFCVNMKIWPRKDTIYI